jgi:AraC-like DNA-binding protein
MSSSALVPLAFGDRSATHCESLLSFAENTRLMIPTLLDYDAADPARFQCRASVSAFGGLTMFSANLPAAVTQARVSERAESTFCFHTDGDCDFRTDGALHRVRPRQTALFIPDGYSWAVTAQNAATVVVSLNRGRLVATAQTMAGRDSKAALGHQFDHPSTISLGFEKLSFDAVFRGLFTQIDLYADQPEMLGLSGIDDSFYRTLAVALDPQAFVCQAEARRLPRDQRRLTRVCEYVMANLDSPITLTDLERIGHMSRKTLHNAFLATYRLAPMQWVREQRLLKARGLLLASSMTVTEVLFASGFTHASQFAALYARRFGELPSVTRKVNR